MSKLRSYLRRALNSVPLGLLQSRLDQDTIVSARGRSSRPRDHRLIVTTTGAGNIGDQAMFESYLANTPGSIIAVVPSEGSFTVPAADTERVDCIALEHLLLTRGSAHRDDLAAYGRLLRRVHQVDLLGADIMDGGYSPRISAMEWTLATASVRAGAATRVLGFSWNARPAPLARALARRAIAAGVIAFPRDPHSLARFVRDAVVDDPSRVAGVADVVFLHHPDPVHSAGVLALHDWMASAGRVALVNVSALVCTSTVIENEIIACVDALVEAGFKIVFLPHVIREGNDDRLVARRVCAHLSADDYREIDTLVTPSDVRLLAGRADVVFTGRMHLGILALSESTPSIIVATQGKVSGLLAMLERPHWCLVPGAGLAREFEVALSGILDEGSESVRASITARLDPLRDLARRNYASE